MRKTKRIDVDTRGVAIYARKSRITNKGDSIGVQFKQCAEYAKKELRLDDEFTFMEYEDKGLSGYFSDRPDFQRMLRDVQDGKIRAIVCYKLDRVGRKTTDLLRLMDFLEKYNVDLLICSNGINTASGFSKIFIQIFAVIAEFERDTLTERITDNMMELAKDGRWLGGNTPMGFTAQRVTTGSGKGKSAYSYLVSIPEEKKMVQRLYTLFRTNRSIQKTAKQMNIEGYRTPSVQSLILPLQGLFCEIRFTVSLINAAMIISLTMREMYSVICLTLMVSTDCRHITKPTKRNSRTTTAHSFLQNSCRQLRASLSMNGLSQ